MALSIGSHHVLTPKANADTPSTWASIDLGDSTTAIVVCVTIYDTDADDGVVSAVDFGALGLTNSTIYYDALCDGHCSIWYGNGPSTSAQTLTITHAAKVTDIAGSITEITGGSIQEESVGTPNTGTSGDPAITWTADGDFSFACMLDDQASAAKVHADYTEIYTTSVGDVVAAQYVASTTIAMSWTEDDGDEDWVVVGAAYEELSATNHYETVEDPVGITDTITNVIGRLVSLAESVGITDIIINVMGWVAGISDSVGVTDVITNIRELAKTLTDPVGITDAITNVRELFKTIADSTGITDVVTTAREMFITLSSSNVITNGTFDTDTDWSKDTGWTIGSNVATSTPQASYHSIYQDNKLIIGRTYAVTFDITEQTLNWVQARCGTTNGTARYDVGTYSQTLVCAGNATFSMQAYSAFSGSIDNVIVGIDPVGATDIVATIVKVVAVLANTVGITDAIVNIRELFKTIADSTGITDTITNARELFKTLADPVGITDIIGNSIGRIISFADSVGVTDVIDTIKTGGTAFFETIEDSVGVTDAITTLVGKLASLVDTVGITDVVTNARGLSKSIANSIGITDVVANTRKLFKTLTDPVGIADTINRAIEKVISFTDNIGITDVLATIKGGGSWVASIFITDREAAKAIVEDRLIAGIIITDSVVGETIIGDRDG